MDKQNLFRRATCCLFLIAFIASNHATVFDIKTKGAKGDGKTDDSPAIMAAWKAACESTAPSSVLIPAGNYMANPPIDLKGPCKAAIEIKATGATLKAPPEVAKFKTDYWISIVSVDKLTMTGGVFDGQGQATWKSTKCHDSKQTCQIPVNIRFTKITNSFINGITSANSKYFHMNVLHCNNTKMNNVTISTPPDSVNTDGIHIGRLTGLNITNSNIKTGDDCISFGDGSKNVHIEKVTCGPGHGISIGSLGKYANEEPVAGVWVKNCTLTGTTNGVRIKSWPSSPPNTASDIHFEDIIMNKVSNPILIDQEYCPWNACQKGSPSKVKISNVTFRRIKGTSSTKVAIQLLCSAGVPCENIELSDINLTNSGTGGAAISQCHNVKPKIVGSVVPTACGAAGTTPPAYGSVKPPAAGAKTAPTAPGKKAPAAAPGKKAPAAAPGKKAPAAAPGKKAPAPPGGKKPKHNDDLNHQPTKKI